MDLCQVAVIFVTVETIMRELNIIDWKSNRFTIVDRTRAGVKREKIDEIGKDMGIKDREMSKILNISERTLHRLRPDHVLDSNASERILLLETLIGHGLEVFDHKKDVLQRWLHGNLPELRQNSPLSLLDTTTGFDIIHTILSRIEYGIYG